MYTRNEKIIPVYKIRILIFFAAFLWVSPANLFAQKESASNLKEENAAVYYNKAFDLLNFPDYKSELFQEVIKVVENGWQEENKKLEDILKVNEPATKEFYKGLALNKCDFTYIRPWSNPAAKSTPNLLWCRNLSSLLILKARKLEYENRFDEATDIYFDVIKFARHISQGESLAEIITGVATDILAYGPLSQYLARPDVDKEVCYKISKFLSGIEPTMITAKEAMELEKKYALSTFRWIRDSSIVKMERDKVEFEKVKNFWDDFLKEAEALTGRYYAAIIKAAETNLPADWDYCEKEIVSLQNELKEYGDPIDAMDELGQRITDKLSIDVAKRMIKLTLVTIIPNVVRAADSIYEPTTMFRIMKTATAVRLYYLETGIMPKRLTDLVPAYLDQVPQDPYAQQSLRYRKEGNSFIIYGVGKDRVDNAGAGKGKFIARAEQGEDIVFKGQFNVD